jgi:RNA polymerase sigma-70 factor (ECF subfamily)
MNMSRHQLDALMAGVARGDEAAFAELYQATSAKLYGVALRILRSKEAAEDVVQDSFFKVWERAGDFDPKLAGPVTWMVAIVRNRALDELRRRAARPSSDAAELDDLPGDDEHPIEAIGRREDFDRLIKCLEGLEPDKRQMVRLAYLDGLSREALAKRFDRPEGTIKTWLHRSLAMLKGCLEQ